MTSPGEAAVVPIALTVDGRSGYTIWAAPWIEDGEEWQAFLGAGSRIFVFEDLDDMADYLSSNRENDLSDHPGWSMLQTLPSDQLEPDREYRFNLDAVPDLTERDADEDVVNQVGDTVDMVQRIAECCDNGALLGVLSAPAFATLLDESPEGEDDDSDDEDADDEDADDDNRDAATATEADADEDDEDEDDDEDVDDVWAEIGEAVRKSWPLLTQRFDECLEWYAVGTLPEAAEEEVDLTPATPDTATAVASLGAKTATVNATADDEDTDEDEAEQDADAEARRAAAAEFWNEVGIVPVHINTPAGEGYTLRCYVDDEPRFLGSDLTVNVFATPEDLAVFCTSGEEHDLSDLDTWPTVESTDPLVVLVAREEQYDLGAAEAQLLAGPYGANPIVLRRAADFVMDVAEYCELAGVLDALAEDSELGQAITAVLRPSVGGLYPVQWTGGEAAARWRDAVAEVESCLRFL